MNFSKIRSLAIAASWLTFLHGCAQPTSFVSIPEPESSQVVQELYGVPTLFSESDNLVALASEGTTFDAEQEILFLRLWVYNGTGEALLISSDGITAELEASRGRQAIPTLQQAEVEAWRQENMKREVVSRSSHSRSGPGGSPSYVEVYPDNPRSDPGVRAGKISKLVRVGPLIGSTWTRQSIFYKKELPQYRSVASEHTLLPGATYAGSVALDMRGIVLSDSDTIQITVDLAGERHQLKMRQASLL